MVGSFLNVCIYRLPRDKSIVFPASHCPSCSHKLAPADLIPIISFFLLRRKCGYCKAPISWRYPLVELVSGMLFVLIFMKYPLDTNLLEIIFFIFFSGLALTIFFIDLELQVIPDSLNLGGILAGLLYNFLKSIFNPGHGLNPFISAILGMAAGYVLLFLIAKTGKKMFKKEAMGEGDLYLAALLGAYFGWQGALLSILLAFFLAALVILPLFILGRIKTGDYLPFGPMLVMGGFLFLFIGEQIINWYLFYLT